MYKYNLLLIKLFELFFPGKCLLCKKSISYKENSICNLCKKKIIQLNKDRCYICSGKVNNNKCLICNSRHVFFDRNISLYVYNDIVKLLIHSFKFKSNLHIGKYFAEVFSEKVKELKIDFDYITAVPVSYKRKQEKGYNPSQIIAKRVSRNDNIKYVELLGENKEYKSQKTLNYNERFINVLGRYFYKKKNICIKNKRILLVDDVFTTGATINECSRILKKMGALQVFSLTIAFVDVEID